MPHEVFQTLISVFEDGLRRFKGDLYRSITPLVLITSKRYNCKGFLINIYLKKDKEFSGMKKNMLGRTGI